MLFLIFQKGISKKTVPSVLRFISMLFEYLKRIALKNCVRYFDIHKYAFFNIWKVDKQETVAGILRFISMLLLIFEKG